MRVEFDATINDRLAANWRAKGSLWKVCVGSVMLVSGVWYLGTVFLWQIPEIATSGLAKEVALGVAFVVGLSVLFLFTRFIRFGQRRALRKMLHGAETFRVVMELTPRGVSVEDPTAQVLIAWPKIKGVHVRGKTIDIVTFHGLILWVPKRAFGSPEEATRFVETVKAYLAEPVRTQGVSESDTHPTSSIQKK